MTNLVSVPGRNISWSQCGIGLNIEKPRIRYRPSSDFTWMSLMTSGVKMLLCPSTERAPSSLWLLMPGPGGQLTSFAPAGSALAVLLDFWPPTHFLIDAFHHRP